jgi:hypothetical protein
MEITIRIMVTLFVALVVAMVIIGFASKMINDARVNVNEMSKDKTKMDNKDRIIEINSITSKNIASLAEECYQESKNSFETDICFVVIGNIEATENEIINELNQLNSTKIDIDLSNAKNAIRIKYNVVLDKIEIIG